MANPEHLEILKQGVEAWNEWREENNDVKPDLSEAELGGENLKEVDLQSAILIRANLDGADLESANFERADLRVTHLREACLNDAYLYEVDLLGGDLRGSKLRNAVLEGANLTSADIRGAVLTGAQLVGTNLYDANLEEANFQNAKLWETLFINTNILKAKELDNCRHPGPSFIDHNTLKKSSPLPIEFLRGIGLQDWQIEEAKLLQPNLTNAEISDIIYRIYDLRAHQAVQVSPLFISYSHDDNKFVDTLEPLFIEKGIRFWRDKHDMKAGRLERQVDRAMRLNPTVLLVLSENSVESDWVEHEAESARELEKQLQRDVLCPVALDDSWKDCKWDKRLRRQIEKYNILDFSQWQDEKMFSRQFSRLVDGLDIYYK